MNGIGCNIAFMDSTHGAGMRIVLKQFCYSVAPRVPTRKDSEAGLTLVEMMVVLVIIAIVAGMVAMNVMDKPDQAKVTTTRSNLATISSALKMYKLENGDYPTTGQGLQALVEKPVTAPVPNSWPDEGYLSETPVDAWGNPYSYVSADGKFTLMSLGKDGKPGGEGLDADLDSRKK